MNDRTDLPKPDRKLCVQSFLLSHWPALLCAVLFVLAEWPVFRDWWGLWNEGEGAHYSTRANSSIYRCLYDLVEQGTSSSGECSGRAGGDWLSCCAAGVLHALATLLGLRVLYMVTFFGLVYGLILLLSGTQVLRILFIPVAFLITMSPRNGCALSINGRNGNAS